MQRREDYPEAIAYIRGGDDAPQLTGEVKFYKKREGVLLTLTASGFPRESGFFALHIHEGGSCGSEGFADTLGHFNPKKTEHPDHAGDLPALLVGGGRAYLSVLTDRFRIEDVIGRTVVIHGGVDDYHTRPAGNAGAKIACGVIRRI